VNYKHIFGPVLSRRLKRSLGIDLVPHKVCNLNCIYCECGDTTILTNERKEWVNIDEIIEELTSFLSNKPELDFITITGSGEPMLNTGVNKLIKYIKENFSSYSTALLTNGTLFTLSEVRDTASLFDYVLPSLDAVSKDAFKKLNRPFEKLDNEKIIEGLYVFSKSYKGTLWLEVFIAPGINDTKEELELLKQAILKISPQRIQLNSLDRPGACSCIKKAPLETLIKIANFLKPLPVEILSRKYISQFTTNNKISGNITTTIMSILSRRPSTIEDLSFSLEKNINDISSIMDILVKSKKVSIKKIGNKIFYKKC
jgi:wyosine [tRNA(Phe)-imidazoG37] synthetase (radical SAM superfamily)